MKTPIRNARPWRRLTCVGALAALAACAEGPRPEGPVSAGGVRGVMRPYAVNGVWYRPAYQPNYDETGLASWYGPQAGYRTTADGEAFDARIASAAHKTLPLPCIVEVTNLDNGRRTRLRVNDRGPFVQGRILDVSRAGAEALGFGARGIARVRVRYVGPADGVARPVERISVATSQPPLASSPGIARVRAGAFSQRVNAERAAQMLAAVGDARIEPTAGGRLWLVIVSGRAGEDAPSLRRLVASLGFGDARALEP